jgi:hypothetical protein
MIKEILIWEKRFKGITKDGTWGVSIPPERDINLYGGWEIEPIHQKIANYFGQKLWNSYQVLGYLKESDPQKWAESAKWCRSIFYKEFESSIQSGI